VRHYVLIVGGGMGAGDVTNIQMNNNDTPLGS